jgi:hypothetical protein
VEQANKEALGHPGVARRLSEMYRTPKWLAVVTAVTAVMAVAAEKCECEWGMEDDGYMYSSADLLSVDAASADKCKEMCCYNEHQKKGFSCMAFSFESAGAAAAQVCCQQLLRHSILAARS